MLCLTGGGENKAQDSVKKHTQLNPNATIKEILKCSSNAFQTWRYLHESDPTNDAYVISYEYMRLNLIADILRETCVKLMQEEG